MAKQQIIRVSRLEKILETIEDTIPLMREEEARGAKKVIEIIRKNLEQKEPES